MSFAAVRSLVSQSDSTVWPPTTTNALNSGELGVISIALDNVGTTDGDLSEVTSVTDTAGNTWIKAVEFTNGNGAAAAGATCSCWYTLATATLSAGGTITVNTSGAPARKAITGHVFSYNSTITNVGSSTRADDAADAGSITVTPSSGSREHLYIRATACESTNISYTPSTNFTAMDHTNSTTFGIGGSAKNMGARGEYRIVTNSSDSTDPTTSTANHASVMVALDDSLPSAAALATIVFME